MKDILVDNKKGCIICTNSFVALATQIAGVMLTERSLLSLTPVKKTLFCFFFFNREYYYCHQDRFPSDPASLRFSPGLFPDLAAWC